MNRLVTDFMGFTLPNPFILASAPPTATPAMIERAFEAGWGGAVIKTLINEPVHNLCNRFGANRVGRQTYGFKNIELVSEISPEEWFEGTRSLKKRYPDRFIAGSIMADARDYENWIELTYQCQLADMDVVELNFSCPNGYPERGKGCAIGQDELVASEIVRKVKADKRITIPIVPKLTSCVTDIVFIGEELAAAGADGFCAINTVPSLMGFNLSTLSPKVNVDGYTTSGGYSGHGIKPIALRCVHELSVSPGIPIMGCGGCMNGSDAIEFILLGSGIVQLATAVMFEGFDLIDKLKSEMIRFMDQYNFSSVADFKAYGSGRVVSFDRLSEEFKTKARVDLLRCMRCGKCETACRDGGYQAISCESPKAYPTVDEEKCTGCSLCSHVCPFNAVEMVRI